MDDYPRLLDLPGGRGSDTMALRVSAIRPMSRKGNGRMPIISADIPEDSLSSAAFGLGLNRSQASRSGIVRAALALYHGHDRETAREYIIPETKKNSRLGSNGQEQVTADVPEDLATVEGVTRAFALRVGLAMAAGLTRKEAENWAKMTVRSVGRPRKEVAA